MREGKMARVLARFKRPSRGGNRWRIVGAGGRDCGSDEPREREAVGGRKGMTGGPDLSLLERGRGRGSWPAGPRPRKRRRGRRVWALQDERRRGRREERFAFFLFQIKFPNIFSN